MAGDLKEIDHWGKTPDGRCVLLDYGFTQDVFKSHYSDDDVGPTVKHDQKTKKPVSNTFGKVAPDSKIAPAPQEPKVRGNSDTEEDPEKTKR